MSEAMNESARLLLLALIIATARVEQAPSFILLDLATVLNIFEQELLIEHHHELAIFGSVICDTELLELKKNFLAGFQLSVHCNSDTLFNDFNITEAAARICGSSASVFIAPPTEELLMELLLKIPLYLKKVPIPSVQTRRIFFISWPTEIDHSSKIEHLVFSNGPKMLKSISTIRQYEEIYVPLWKKREGKLELWDIVEVYGSRGEIPVIQRVLPPPSKDDLNLEEMLPIAVRRQDFRGGNLLVLGQPDESFLEELTLEEMSDGTVKFVKGTVLEMLQGFMFTMNFTYSAVKGNGWMGLSPNNAGLTGLGDQIMRKEADLCISLNEFEHYRSQYVRYLQPLKTYPSYMMFLQPSIHSNKNVLLAPFSGSVWFLVFAAWAVLLVCGCLLLYRRPPRVGHVGTTIMYSRYFNVIVVPGVSELFVWTTATLCQKGWELRVAQPSFKIFCVTAVFFSILIYAFYTSFVVASTSIPTKPVNEVEDLLNLNYKIYMDPGQPMAINGFGLMDTERESIYSESVKDFKNFTSTVPQVLKKPGVALVSGLTDFYASGLHEHKANELCRADKLRADPSVRQRESMVIRKSGSFKEFFAYRSVVLIERGLADLYGRRYDRRAGIQCPDRVEPEYELDFPEVYMAYVLLFIGTVLSLSILYTEKRFNHRKRIRRVSLVFDNEFAIFTGKHPERRFRNIARALTKLAYKLR